MTVEAAENTVELPANWKDLIVTSSSEKIEKTYPSSITIKSIDSSIVTSGNFSIKMRKYNTDLTGTSLYDSIVAGEAQTIEAKPTSDEDAIVVYAQILEWAANKGLTYQASDGTSSEDNYPNSITFTAIDTQNLSKTNFASKLRIYNANLGLADAMDIYNKVASGEKQTIEAAPTNGENAKFAFLQIRAWATKGVITYTLDNDSSTEETKDITRIIKTIKFSNGIVPTNAKKMATDLYYTLDETTGALVFYASDSKTIIAPENSTDLFKDLRMLTTIDFTNFKTSNTTNMLRMFFYCESLESLDLSMFDTSNVSNMSLMFAHCKSLTNLNLSSFNTSKVTDMYGMFEECCALKSINVSSFDTSKVTDMNHMFNECSVLTNLDLRSFDTNSVVNMGFMFTMCKQLTEITVSSNFSTANVTNITCMFSGCGVKKLTLSNFDFSNVTDADNALPTGSNISADLSNVDLSNSTVCAAVAGFVTGNTFEDLNLTGCDLEQLSEAMEEGSSIDTKSITFDTDKVGRADIALTNPLYNNGVEYNTIDSSISGTATGTVKLTNTKGDVPSTGVVTESILPAIITLALLMSLSVAGLALKKKKNK